MFFEVAELIKLIVVDDESNTRKGLIKHIPWTRLGVDVVEDAKDGIEALEIAKQLKPDILLSDIRMPGMDGIELAYAVRDLFPDCKIIFLSGYADKDYLKSAIHLKALRYVEKPINTKEVMETVKEAVELCLKDQSKNELLFKNIPFAKQNILLNLINRKADIDSIQNDLDTIGIRLNPAEHFRVVIFKFSCIDDNSAYEPQVSNPEFLEIVERNLNAMPNITAYKDDRHVVSILLSAGAKSREKISQVLENIKSEFIQSFGAIANIFIAVGKDSAAFSRIFESYESAVVTLQKLFFFGYNKIAYYNEKTSATYVFENTTEKNFSNYLKEKDRHGAISYIERLCTDIKKYDSTIVNHIKNLFFKLSLLLINEVDRRGLKNESSDEQETYLWELISSFKTIDEISEYMIDKTSLYLTQVEQLEAVTRSTFDAIKYIEKNYYNQSLSTQKISESVHLTPTYLCALFKKETGKTISDYITDVRIQKSKELLSDRNVKLFEIAREVGYNDPNYFAKTFKKQTGMTPSEYRGKYLL
jgi:two-component system, response regulator YesN